MEQVKLPLAHDVMFTHNGRAKVNSLFIQTNNKPEIQRLHPPVFSLTSEDVIFEGRLLPSIKNIYLEIGDVTEYQFVMAVFGSLTFWDRVLQNKRVLRYVQEWREELELRVRSAAINSLIKIAGTADPRSVAAAKYVAERGWVKGKKTTQDKQIQEKLTDEFSDDADRIGLSLVKK